ncbi:hypothetical protein QTJ16_006175 [Diplocarpon rosae]|uniref:Uncharacterized protein n=1 Tax=Diplocarpon rosae TaxID=946125 RepID=A0AAD9WAH2_9HELO|nr:hypothetical protein QTJ16_006175 [Diplocarpon rosae]PBP23947.1 hypothetical protein BUE80_DR005041 [Diplocarpon rosae]
MATGLTTPDDSQSIYKQLENYSWDSDREFQGGLSAILGPNPSPSQLQDLTLRAQCFYLSRKKGISIDFDGYKAYISLKEPAALNTSSPASTSTSLLTTAQQQQEEATTSPQSSSFTSKMAVNNTPTDPSHCLSAATAAGPQDAGAPYPASFAEIVALIQSGAEIPGIRHIPLKVIGYENSKPSVLPKRRKPWEKDVPEEVIQGRGPRTFGDERDVVIEQEYPEGV